MKKFKLTNNKKEWFGRTLYQIESLINFGSIHVGDKGGWIEKEENLAQDDNAWVYGDAEVYGNARVFGDAEVFGNARVYGDAEVYGNARVFGDAEVYGNARVFGDAEVFGNARVFGDAEVFGNAEVFGDAAIIWISKIGSRYGTTTVFKNKDGGLSVVCGCFFGTFEEFEKKVEATHGDNKYGREYKALISLIKIHFEVQDEQ